jgi:hypothetical protein
MQSLRVPLRLQRYIRFLTLLFSISSISTLLPCSSTGQISDKISSVTVGEYVEGQPLAVRAELSRTAGFERIFLAYRQFGQSEYKEIEMSVVGNVASATIPGSEVHPPFIEYYLIIQIQGQATAETYPLENPRDHPLRATFRTPSERDREVIVLSPEEGEQFTAEEFFVSVSLLRASKTVDRQKTKVYLDNADVTPYGVLADDLLLLRGSNLPFSLRDGSHSVRIELYDRGGKLYHSMSFPTAVAQTPAMEAEAPRPYNVSVQMESRNETISDDRQSYNRGAMNAAAVYGQFTVRGKLYVTNEEKSYRQPQNRFFIGVESPWAKVGYGDSYPTFPRLIMDGKRLRGFTGSASIAFFNLDVAVGDVVRKIEGGKIATFRESDTASFNRYRNDPIALYDTTTADSARWWVTFRPGTFSRQLLAVRPSFGRGESFQLGFSYLKSKDDDGSIRYGVKPQENVVLGSDLFVGIDDRHIELTAQAAFSASNKDISGGAISDSTIDRLFSGRGDSTARRDELRTIRDRLSGLITINEHLVPLSLTNLTTLAYEGALSLNYFNNYFKFSYIRRGNNYESFGQNFLRSDIKGFTITDRVRLFQNQIFLTAGVERLEDNLGETKPAATIFTTYNGSVTYVPKVDFPNITLGYLGAVNDNGLNKDSISAVVDRSSRLFLQAAYDFTMGIRHTAMTALALSSRDDETFRNADTKNTTASLALTSYYRIPLQTTASVIANFNRLATFIRRDSTITSDVNYTTVFMNAQYRLLGDKLRLGGTLSPTFGVIQRTLYELNARYFFMPSLSAATQVSFYQNRAATNDVVWVIALRYDI